MQPGFFADLLLRLKQAVVPGLAAVEPYLWGLLLLLLFLELTRCAIDILMGADPAEGLKNLGRMVFKANILLWLWPQWTHVVTVIVDSGAALGLVAGGAGLTLSQFLDPGVYLTTGMQAAQPILDQMTGSWGLKIATGLFYCVAWVTFVLAYAVMGLTVFITQVYGVLFVVLSFVALPFFALRGTRWIATGTISYLANYTAKVFVLALLTSLAFPFLRAITITPEPAFEPVLAACLAAWLCAYLMIKGASFAGEVLGGIPSAYGAQALVGVSRTLSAIAVGAEAAVSGGAAAVGYMGATRAAGLVTSGAPAAGGGIRTLSAGGAAGTTMGRSSYDVGTDPD